MPALVLGIPRDIAATRVTMGPATAMSTSVYLDTSAVNGVMSIKVVPSMTLHTGIFSSMPGSSIPVPSMTSGRESHGERVTEHSCGGRMTSTHCASHTVVAPTGSAMSSMIARDTVDRMNVSTVTFNSSLSSPSSGATVKEMRWHSRSGNSDVAVDDNFLLAVEESQLYVVINVAASITVYSHECLYG